MLSAHETSNSRSLCWTGVFSKLYKIPQLGIGALKGFVHTPILEIRCVIPKYFGHPPIIADLFHYVLRSERPVGVDARYPEILELLCGILFLVGYYNVSESGPSNSCYPQRMRDSQLGWLWDVTLW